MRRAVKTDAGFRESLPPDGPAEVILTLGSEVRYFRVSRDELDRPLRQARRRARIAGAAFVGATICTLCTLGLWRHEAGERRSLLAHLEGALDKVDAKDTAAKAPQERVREALERVNVLDDAFRLYVEVTRPLLAANKDKLTARLRQLGADPATAFGGRKPPALQEGGANSLDPALSVLTSYLSMSDRELLAQDLDLARSLDAVPATAPLANFRITSGYGIRRNPISGGLELHRGIDMAADGTPPIVAASSGVVASAGWRSGYGLAVVVQSDAGFETLYGHMSRIDVVARQIVRSGQRLGLMGATGSTTGPHLHFEVKQGSRYVDPQLVLAGARNVQ